MSTSTNAVAGLGAAQAAESAYSPNSAGAKTDADQVGKDDFLRLLVAQIRNQDPLSPADGVQFLAQLAQFSQLEQLININTSLQTLVANQTGAATQAGSADQTGKPAAA